jgi:hypothetical protein
VSCNKRGTHNLRRCARRKFDALEQNRRVAGERRELERAERRCAVVAESHEHRIEKCGDNDARRRHEQRHVRAVDAANDAESVYKRDRTALFPYAVGAEAVLDDVVIRR